MASSEGMQMGGMQASNWAQAGSTVFDNFISEYEKYRAGKESAKELRRQAGIYGFMADSQIKTASMYAGQARMAAAYGRSNAKNLRLAAAHLDRFEQLALHHATLQARARVGAGRAGFAGNGVLVDSGSAAKWEQDEAADAALEQLDIMQQFEDQGWQYRTQANKALAEGYAAAAGHAGAAMGAATDAWSLRQQQIAKNKEAEKKAKVGWGSIIGGITGGAIGAIIGGIYGGGPVGAAVGANTGTQAGTTTGKAYDYFVD